jgi:uncharacterized protein
MRRISTGLVLLGIATAAFTALPASAASFRCARAKLADEKAICADRKLNDLDVELAVRLEVLKHLVPMGTRGALMDDQQSWLAARRECGGDRNCLTRRYADRLEEINGGLQKVYGRGPF